MSPVGLVKPVDPEWSNREVAGAGRDQLRDEGANRRGELESMPAKPERVIRVGRGAGPDDRNTVGEHALEAAPAPDDGSLGQDREQLHGGADIVGQALD